MLGLLCVLASLSSLLGRFFVGVHEPFFPIRGCVIDAFTLVLVSFRFLSGRYMIGARARIFLHSAFSFFSIVTDRVLSVSVLVRRHFSFVVWGCIARGVW